MLRRAIALDPGYVRAYNERGNSKYALKRYEEALQDFNKALELCPRNHVCIFMYIFIVDLFLFVIPQKKKPLSRKICAIEVWHTIDWANTK